MNVKIEVKNLSKSYGSVKAVNDVSFSVGDQQVLGFLGPNGAGKTTVMKILTGFHFPQAGSAVIDGISVEEEPLEVKKRIGYLPENVPLYSDLTVYEYLSFVSNARLIPKKQKKSAIDSSIEACGLANHSTKKIETLSKGYKQRTGLAQAILHDPPILILDEPTTGLDPNQIIEIRTLIKELGKRKTVILSTHILQEVEAICSQVLIINNGKVVALGRPEEIAGSLKGGDTWELLLKGQDADSIRNKILLLGDISKTDIKDTDDGLVRAVFFIPQDNSSGNSGESIFDWACGHNIKILEMIRKKISIEDIFVKLTEGGKTAKGENE